MAVVNNQKKEEQTQNSTTSNRYAGGYYNGLEGVSSNTASKAGGYQAGYQPSQTVVDAQSRLQQTLNAKPQTYNSKYSAILDDILGKIENPEEFHYDFNGDELFKSYADLYTQKGKQASLDAIGQASALTGGYGNSYAWQVGNQANQQYLLSLYDKGLDLYDRARAAYESDRADQYNRLNAFQSADSADYAKYRDLVSDWQTERQMDQSAYENERAFDYNDYSTMLNYWTGLAEVENADYRSEQERQEAIREYEQDFAEKVREYDTSLAENQRQYDTSFAENQRQFNENLAENARQADQSLAYNYASLAENQRQYDTSMAYDYDKLNWQMTTDERDYNRDVLESDRELAYNYVTSILANGQTPSAELLAQAGLSESDAALMLVKASSGSGGKKKTSTTEDTDTYVPMSYYDASKLVLQNTPLNLTVGELNGSNDSRTLQNLKSRALQDLKKKLGLN